MDHQQKMRAVKWNAANNLLKLAKEQGKEVDKWAELIETTGNVGNVMNICKNALYGYEEKLQEIEVGIHDGQGDLLWIDEEIATLTLWLGRINNTYLDVREYQKEMLRRMF
ncbi:uncharacterized protein [Antedon mediterranea]|uniref:uncharacterized protein n=1 Tax=Antedon mediterranea TaxID=105859 RepID=UPI003AF78EEB